MTKEPQMSVTERDVLDILNQIEQGDLTLFPDVNPQEQIKGDILYRASNGWKIEVSNWSGAFGGIVEITLPNGQILDLEYLDAAMPNVAQYFPTNAVAWQAYHMRTVETGYVYESEDKPGPFETAHIGEIVANPTPEPPWLVVSHTLQDVTVARWPGRLWLAQVIERLEPQNHRGHYTRSIAVKLLKEMKTAHLFGLHGKDIEEILRYAKNLTPDDAEHLSTYSSEQARQLQEKGWNSWMHQTQGAEPSQNGHMIGVVAAGNGRSRSPIGHGLSLIHTCVWEAAKSSVGDVAFEEDEEECWLISPWSEAVGELMNAAWALGAPDLFTPEERERLLHAWTHRRQRD